jgi:hypothetical protein
MAQYELLFSVLYPHHLGMNEFLRNLPEVIRASASSNLGILALIIIALAIMALFFFRQAAERTRIWVFILFFGGALAFGITVLRETTNLQPSDETSDTPQPIVSSPTQTPAPAKPAAAPADESPTPQTVPATEQPAQSKPRVYVYYANRNQFVRLNSRVSLLLTSNGFEVSESRQLSLAEAPNRPDVTEVLHFSSHGPNEQLANKLKDVLLTALAGEKMKYCQVMRNDPNAAKVTQSRHAGEFVVWFGKVVASPSWFLHESPPPQ